MAKEKPYSPVKRFFNLLTPDNKDIRDVYIFAASRGLVNLTLPIGIQAIMNFIQGGQVNAAYIVLSSLVLLGVFSMGIFQVLQLKIMERIQQKIFSRAAFEFTYRIPKIKLEILYKRCAPELMNRFFDVTSVQKGLSKILIDFATAVLYLVFGLLLLTLYHSFFILFSVLLVVFAIILVRTSGSKGLEYSFKESTYKYKLIDWLQELAKVSTTFKLAGDTKLHLKKTDEYVINYLNYRDKHFNVLVWQYSLMLLYKIIMTLGLLVIGGILVMQGEMNIGQFVAAEIILLFLIGAIEKIIISLESIYDVLTALEKIAQVTDLELDEEEGVEVKTHAHTKGLNIKVSNLSFYYPIAKKYAVKDLSFDLASNESLMILGKDGSGKSSLIRLLIRFCDPKAGFINYDAIPIAKISNLSFRDMIGAYVKTASVFKGTLHENIIIDRDGLNEDYVKEVLDKLDLQETITRLPQDIHTPIVEDGKNFNESFIRRLCIAREIVSRPRLLILEDPFRSLYSVDMKKMIDFLLLKENNWTLIVETPNQYFFEKCDKVLLLNQGSSLFYGTPDQFKEQFKDYKQYLNA